MQAVKIEGLWIIERSDGRRVEHGLWGSAFKTKAVAEAVIEYLKSPKPVAPSDVTHPAKKPQGKKRLKQLAEERKRATRDLRFALQRDTPEHGFESD